MPAISCSIFRITLREQHRARSTGRALSSIRKWCRWCSMILWWREPRYGAQTATFPRMDEFVGIQRGAYLPLLSSPHPLPLHLSFLSCFVLDIYSAYATVNRTHHAPLVAIQNRNRSRVAPYMPMRSFMAFVAGSGNCGVPGSSCSIDVLCTWAACAPTGAKSISFCLLHFYGLHWP
ncbi:hypothetical protein B0H13DRAFT_157004 [Mycena leptocephala]|nr:hypothetical protein B0H13DRAFT_157004 [Mycena leptocephala]